MGSVSPSGGRYINTTTNPVSVTFQAKQEQSTKISLQIPLLAISDTKTYVPESQ